MQGEGAGRQGVARLDGLMDIGFTPDPDLDIEVEECLRRLAAASRVHLNISRERGSVSILPSRDSFTFSEDDPPGRALLAAIRELVETVRRRTECRVESSLRLQEFLGDAVVEGVFVYSEVEGVTVTARERPIQPGERPELPEPSLAVRAESLLRKYQWPVIAVGAIVVVTWGLGLLLGWWGTGAGSVEGPKIDAGPLQDVVVFEKVRWRKEFVSFEVKPGSEFGKFEEVAKACSLRPGIFRVLFLKEGVATGQVLPLDLRSLPDKVKDLEEGKSVGIQLPYAGGGFDEVWICH